MTIPSRISHFSMLVFVLVALGACRQDDSSEDKAPSQNDRSKSNQTTDQQAELVDDSAWSSDEQFQGTDPGLYTQPLNASVTRPNLYPVNSPVAPANYNMNQMPQLQQGVNPDFSAGLLNTGMPLYVIMGGNLSCKQNSPYSMNLFVNFQEQLQARYNLRGGLPPVLLTCYAKKRQVFFSMPQGGGEAPVFQASEETIASIILANSRPDQQIILIGHSYGGWLSMRAAEQLMTQRSIARLFTIDPISPVDCTLKNRVGCKRAPVDIDEFRRAEIAKNVGRWENFYGCGNFLHLAALHSGPIMQAHDNIETEESHFSILKVEGLWRSTFAGLAL